MAQKSFMAMITPISSGHPDHELPKPQPPARPGQPPHVDHTLPGDFPKPSHPIYYPLPPGAPVDPSYGVPIERPSHPIAPGGAPPRPDQSLPGAQPHPDQGLPGPQPHPEHPIVLPPDSGGWLPVYIWGPGDPRPTPPIVIPPDAETDDGATIKFKALWTEENGWQVVGVVIPGDEGKPIATPSGQAQRRK